MKQREEEIEWLIGDKPITHYSVIKEKFTFLYGGSNQPQIKLFFICFIQTNLIN